MSIRTDLAIECIDFAKEALPKGVHTTRMEENGITVNTVEIRDEEAAEQLSKPVGRYVTIETSGFEAVSAQFEAEVQVIAQQIRTFLPQKGRSFLIVGLGNSDITPDALGPQAVRYIFTTRHIGREMAERLNMPDLSAVSAIAPGVLGQTGMETAEIVTALCGQIKPDLAIVIDALASGSVARLGSTIQLSNTGISPGSGVLNKRKELSRATLGVPVLSIGVPTVVDLGTIVRELSDRPAASSAGETMMVTPRGIDNLIEHASKSIAYAINMALQPSLSLEEIAALTA
ncbi:GPR endopeptidase [Massiliimalia timonensis]|uniref:GPR endopeptidase n=1 Tax=Massiliimalia timonensis TaxID=1987501 RepID=UPI000B8B6A87|nr:GPR endopeptidase [Massiliimalia timonensis]MBS7174578.1 GPR endopeptidase [Clostridiales bacterium]